MYILYNVIWYGFGFINARRMADSPDLSTYFMNNAAITKLKLASTDSGGTNEMCLVCG